MFFNPIVNTVDRELNIKPKAKRSNSNSPIKHHNSEEKDGLQINSSIRHENRLKPHAN